MSVGGISMIPGGLGTQDASMAGIFSAFGMSLANTALVVILFRVVSDFIPSDFKSASLRPLYKKKVVYKRVVI